MVLRLYAVIVLCMIPWVSACRMGVGSFAPVATSAQVRVFPASVTLVSILSSLLSMLSRVLRSES